MHTIMALASAILSGLLLYASLPPLDLSVVVWVALLPLCLVLRSGSYRRAFAAAFVTGAVFCGLHVRWVGMLPSVPVVAFLTLVLYGAMFYGGFGLGVSVLVRRTRWPMVLTAPALWVVGEFIRSNLAFLALPFALLGYSQHTNLAILQWASLTSVYGISCLIVLVNVALAEGVRWGLGQCGVSMPPARLPALAALGVALLSLLAVWLWGMQQVRRLGGPAPGLLTASLIQGNIRQHEKWDPQFQALILQRYSDLTRRAAQDRPDLVIWPEAATPGSLGNDPSLARAITNLVRETQIPLLLGSTAYAKLGRAQRTGGDGLQALAKAPHPSWQPLPEGEEEPLPERPPRRLRPTNTVFLLDARGRVVATYDKMRLLPFGEYLPLAERFAWPRWLVPSHGRFLAGTAPMVFELSTARFGVAICWESFFSGLFREFVQAGAQFMVNPTNEAWFAPEASRQFLVMSIFRAVEHRMALLRVANTGITSLIDPLGRVRERVRDAAGNDIMVGIILNSRITNEPNNKILKNVALNRLLK